jgi:putative copper export protein
MVDSLITWAVRAIHVAGAALWLGGFAIMLLAIVPSLAREPVRQAQGKLNESVRAIALATARVISIAGAVTVIAGLVMISRSRGYGFLLTGEWGGIVISSIVLAIVMGAIGDAGLRPAICRLDPDVPGSVLAVRRWALAGLIVGVLAVLLMTRAIYARP